MKNIALNRLNMIGAPKGQRATTAQKVAFLAELAKYGYRITNPEKLNSIAPSFLENYSKIISQLSTKKGGNVDYVPLFKNFPVRIPEDGSYIMRRLIGFIGNVLNLYDDNVRLSNGTLVPKWLFDVYEFGADPVTQMQSADLYELAIRENDLKTPDSHTEWTDLKLADEEEMNEALKEFLQKLLYNKSSVKEALQTDIFKLLDHFEADLIKSEMIVFKETKALVLKHFWESANYKAVIGLASTATDVLRMFAAVTETNVSLSEKIRFPKMNRKARKTILTILEKSASLPEDIKKYKGLWLEIGRYLHPGEYAKQFPETARTFDALRNGRIETYASQAEQYIIRKDLEKLLPLMESKPGIYARKLHELLRKFSSQTDRILQSFEKAAKRIPVKNVLIMKRYFDTINTSEYRTVVNKKGKIKIMGNNALGALSEETIHKVSDLLEKILVRLLSGKDSWEGKKAWIAPGLSNYTIPLQQRKTSDGILTVGRGSRIEVDFDKVLRLFVYWKQAQKCTDLDLSVIQFDEHFKYMGHVSYTQLSSEGIVHSGDIQSAPKGAAEFIDITLSKLSEKVRYLAVQVYRYAGDHFSDMDCHAGWMMREKTDTNMKTFDIKTVANKFDLQGNAAYALPLIVDIEARQIITTDLNVSGSAFHNNVEGAYGNIALICSQISNFVKTKPTLQALADYNVRARQAVLTENKEEADITFGYSGCTYNATDTATILSELI